MYFSSFPCACYMPRPSHLPSFELPNNMRPINNVVPHYVIFSGLLLLYSPQHPVWATDGKVHAPDLTVVRMFRYARHQVSIALSAVQSGTSSTFRRIVLPTSSGSKSEPSKLHTCYQVLAGYLTLLPWRLKRCYSATSVSLRATQRYNPQDSTAHNTSDPTPSSVPSQPG
jgi:hypothetical protein